MTIKFVEVSHSNRVTAEKDDNVQGRLRTREHRLRVRIISARILKQRMIDESLGDFDHASAALQWRQTCT